MAENDNYALAIYTSNGTSGNINHYSGTYPTNFPVTFPAIQPLVATDFHIYNNICKDYHRITADLLQFQDDEIVGYCGVCGVRVFIPRVPGAFSYEKAGNLVGRAMSLDEDDEDEAVAELFSGLAELEEQIKRDQRRYERALEMLQIAKTIAQKQIVKIAS